MPAVVSPDGPSPGAGAGADELSGLAARALANLAPLEFDVAATSADRDTVLRMRYACVVEEGWARPADHPDGRERDEYDDTAIFVVCRDGPVILGSLRVVPPSPDRLLPTERDFGIRARPAGRVPEVGRIVVDRAARRARRHLVLGGLCARAWLELRALGYDRTVSAAAPEIIELYRSVGMRVAVLGPSKVHWGTARAPVQITGDAGSFAFLTG